MPNERRDIGNHKVRRFYEKYKTFTDTAKALKCSVQLVVSTINGERIDPNIGNRSKRMCECCGWRPIYPGFRKLCFHCWRNAHSEVIDTSMDAHSGYYCFHSIERSDRK